MEIKEELRSVVAAYRDAVLKVDMARRTYDTTRRTLKETEQSLFYEGTLDGSIDGKNAETREAQAIIVYRKSTDWQSASDAYRIAEEAYRTAQSDLSVAEMDLKVTVVIANLTLGEMSSERLATAVDLAI